MKYVVIKKCYANEFVMVEADSEQEAIAMAKDGEGEHLGGYLEFGGYRPTESWEVEEVEELSIEPPTISELKQATTLQTLFDIVQNNENKHET
jgi:hypothetical protein